jgi:subtilisin family serine protease
MKKLSFIFLILIISGFSLLAKTHEEPVITSSLSQELVKMEPDEMIRINIALNAQYDAESLIASTRYLPQKEKRQVAISELKAFSERTQSSILKSLLTFVDIGKVSKIDAFWIANVINCYATPEVIDILALRNDVLYIDYDKEQLMIDPRSYENSELILTPEGIQEITWNVSKVNAPQVWDLGYEGQGIVISVLDTGVNYNHNDITNNMWTHPDYPYHGWNYVSNNNNPMDDNGHGTHCAGTVAGDGTSGSQTGVAPQAKIMAMKILDGGGSGVPSYVWNGIQFSIDNGAHVLSLSLGWVNASNSDRQVWRNTFDNALAAGVISSVAAGNEGNLQFLYPIPNNVRTPGTVPPPWLHPDQTLTGGISGVMSIGATNSSDGLANFSSRGPVTWQNVPTFGDYPYNPGIGLIRPDVVAPGDNVKSLSYTNLSGYDNMSGTSMAAPCVAGVMALMFSKNENLTPAQMCEILETTTVVLTPGKNNNTGSGRVDALAAVNAVTSAGPEYYSHTINDSLGFDNGMINPGEFIYLTIDLKNYSSDAVENVSVEISTSSPYIQLVDNSEFYGDFNSGQIISIENGFSFEVSDDIPNTERVDFEIISTDGNFEWESEFYITASSPSLLPKTLTVNDHDGNLNGLLDPGESATVFINTVNIGEFETHDAIATLTTDYPYALIETSQTSLGIIAASDSIEGVFNMALLPEAEFGDPVLLTYSIDYGGFSIEKEYTIHVSALIEDFETADLNRFPWSSRGHALWEVIPYDELTPIDGNFAAKSGLVDHNQRTELTLSYYVSLNDTISFYYWVSSEEDGDFLKFYINNQLQDQWSGETGWQWATFPVSNGNKVFKWEYHKNASISVGEDFAMLDFIALPPGQTTTVFAGEDVIICENQVYNAIGVASNYTHSIWTSSGDGTFSSPNSLITEYTPGPMDIENENAVLTLEVTGNDNIIYHSLSLGFIPEPLVSAGDDVSICAGDALMLEDAVVENAELIIWSSSGSGMFDDPHALQTTYTPSDQDIEDGSLVITLTATGIGTCGDAVSSFNLVIYPLPTATISGDAVICHGENTALSIELTGTPPWEVLTSNFDEPVIINESPFMLDVSPDQTTVYTLISVTDANMCANNGEGEATVTVNFIPAPPVMPAAPDTIDYAYNTSTVFVIDEVEYATDYVWTIEPAQAGSITHDGAEATVAWADNFQGDVSVSVIALSDCGESDPSEIKEVYLKNTIGIMERESKSAMILFPNPTTGLFSIQIQVKHPTEIDVKITNLSGQEVYAETNLSIQGQSTHLIDPGNLDGGIYFVSVISLHGIIGKRLIISK